MSPEVRFNDLSIGGSAPAWRRSKSAREASAAVEQMRAMADELDIFDAAVIGGGVNVRLGLPAFWTSSLMPAMIFLQHSWPNSMAWTTSSSEAPSAPASTMTMPLSVPATTMLSLDSLASS